MHEMKGSTLAIFVVILIIYIGISGVIFHFLEYEAEEDIMNDLRNATRKFLEKYPMVEFEDLVELSKKVVDANNKGVFSMNESRPNWDIPSAVFFATTVVTTIGYGHLAPKSLGGQAYCIFFTITGIPLCLLVLSGIGETLHEQRKKLNKVLQRLFCKHCTTYRGLSQAAREFIIFLITFCGFIPLPALVFHYVEGWHYGTCLYYVIITLSTVGFGDYIAGVNQAPGFVKGLYRIVLSVYCFVGLAWLASIMANLEEVISSKTEKIKELRHVREKNIGNKIHADSKGSKVTEVNGNTTNPGSKVIEVTGHTIENHTDKDLTNTDISSGL